MEGDIEDVDGVLKITKIRLLYRFQIRLGSRDEVDTLLESFAEKCPAYLSVRDSIECSWDAEIVEG